jgi:hypothetical protein
MSRGLENSRVRYLTTSRASPHALARHSRRHVQPKVRFLKHEWDLQVG